ncbi:unnamed protein product [Rotaria sp. Silwood2]|nr:unnamed protein product [Rotaria sp. Silwood2]
MSTELSARDKMVTQWFFRDQVCHDGQIATPEAVLFYMRTLMDVASADGILTQKEREWIMGFAIQCGASENTLDQLRAYQPGISKDVKTLFQDLNLPHGEMSRFGLIYFGLQAASADGELHSKELEGIHALEKKMGLTDQEIKQVHELYEENEKLRQKRAAVLYPKGFDNFLTHINASRP